MLIAEAVGEIDNGSGSGGVCPECRGYVVDNQSLGTPLLIDVDAISGNGRTLADVVNMSFAGGVSRASLLELYRKNIVAVAASGNNMMNHGNCSQASYASGTEVVTEGGIEFKQIQPRNPDPAATAAEIPGAPGQFIKPIAVGATMLERWHDQEDECETFNWHDRGDYSRGRETFLREFTYSPGTAKFSSSMADQQDAYIDVVAPTGRYTRVHNGILSCTPGTTFMVSETGTFSCDNPATTLVSWEELADWRYMFDTWGTSHSAPLVSGLVGLMRSLDRDLDQDLDNDLDEGSLFVHLRAYDIVTMTADKIIDDGRYWGDGELDDDGSNSDDPDGIPHCDNGTEPFIRNKPPTQPEYAVQVNDPLKRSWAQRMGFGRVNAYRAVAHAIPAKGKYEYTASETLNATTAETGDKLIHLGWWVGNDGTSDISHL